MNKPFNIPEHLCMSEEPSEVDMEQVTTLLEHNIVVMPVTNTQHIRHYAVPRT